MIRFLLSCCLVFLCATAALAQQGPKPIKLWLAPAKLPSPPLRYQLLPDARIKTSGDAAPIYKQVIELLAKKQFGLSSQTFYDWSEMPLNQLPREEMHKELIAFDDVFELLDKAARCDHCDWGVLQRLREKGIGALLPELQPMRECALLISVRARLEMAEGHYDKALQTLRSGFAVARNTGEGDTLVNFLVGVAIAAIMEKQLDQFISLPGAPNLYYTLTDLPTPLISMRRGIEAERVGFYGTFPGFAEVATNPNAGNLPEEQLKLYSKIVDGLSKDSGLQLPYVERILVARDIQAKHEMAKKALVEAGRPRDKVEAMPHLQVAMLHSLLEYDAVLDNMILWHNLPYWEYSQHILEPGKLDLQSRLLNPKAPAIPLASLMVPSIKKVAFSKARNERKIALLRTVEAIRLYAATHDGQLPPSLAAITEVPIPLDPVNGKSFEYQVNGETASLRAPPPGKEAPNQSNSVVYEMRIRK